MNDVSPGPVDETRRRRFEEAWDTAVERLDRAVARYQAILARSPGSVAARQGCQAAVERRDRAKRKRGE